MLCAEVPCWSGDDVWSTDAGDLAGAVAEDLERNGLPATDHVHAEVRRLPHVYPVFLPGHREALSALEAWVDGLPNTVTLGRQGRFVPDNLHHVLAMGRDVAAALRPDGTFDAEAWRRARAAYTAHVVED